MFWPFWPTDAQREAAIVARSYERLVETWRHLAPSRVPPSMEVLVEEARRGTRTLLQVIEAKRASLR